VARHRSSASKAARCGDSGICQICLLDASQARHSWYVPQGGDPEAEQVHAGEILSHGWLVNAFASLEEFTFHKIQISRNVIK